MTRTAAFLALLAPLALAGCGVSEPEPITFPTFTGHKVIYVADADGDDLSVSGDEAYVADTGSLTQEITRIDRGVSQGYYGDLPGAVGTTGPFVYRVVRDPTDGCPSELKMLPFAGGDTETLFSGECVYGYASNPAGDRFVVMATVGDTGTNLYVVDPADPTVVHQINVGNTGFPGTVSDFAVSADGTTLFWADATGVATTDLTQSLTTINTFASLLMPGDHPTGLFALHDGTAVVYARDDEEQFKLVWADGSGFTYLTNPLGVGDLIGRFPNSVRISADDSQMLYEVAFSGVKQLNRVPLGSPGSETRADSAASSILQTNGYSFEFSADSASYAWIGDGGVNGAQVFGSTVATPGTIVALSPAGEEPVGSVRWTDNATVAYISDDTDQSSPTGATALRTVNTATPGTTLALGPIESDGYTIGGFTTCSDGTVVFERRNSDTAGVHTMLFTADPIAAASAVQITPEIISPSDEIAGFTCVD